VNESHHFIWVAGVFHAQGHYVHEGQPYCQLDFYRAKGLLCVRCETPVGVGDKSFEGRAWHKVPPATLHQLL
jgi:hypothetical protein